MSKLLKVSDEYNRNTLNQSHHFSVSFQFFVKNSATVSVWWSLQKIIPFPPSDWLPGQLFPFIPSIKIGLPGIPWWSSGQDSLISLPRAQVRSLVGILRSYKPRGADKKKKPKPDYLVKNGVVFFSRKIFISLDNITMYIITSCP